MDSNEPFDEASSEHGHLGESWEIAIIVIFILIAVGLVGAVVFQVRRRRREKRRRVEQQQVDAERGQRKAVAESRTRRKGRSKHPDSAYPRSSEKRGNPASSGKSIEGGPKPEGDVRPIRAMNGSEEFVQPPPPAAQPKRNSKASSYDEYVANNSPKYHWDQR